MKYEIERDDENCPPVKVLAVSGGTLKAESGIEAQFTVSEINVRIRPVAARTHARWNLHGMRPNDVREHNKSVPVLPGTYRVRFYDAPGFITPSTIVVIVDGGTMETVIGIYEPTQ